MNPFRIVNPPSLGEPRGWNNGMLAAEEGRVLFVAGQVASDESGSVPEGLGFVGQFGLALDRAVAVVRAAGGGPEHIGRLTMYVTDMEAYRQSLRSLGPVYREHMGPHYPAMTLVQVASLVERHALVEVEATAVIPRQNADSVPDR